MLAVLVVLVAVAGVYMQTLGGTFLWDDRPLVLYAPLVERTAPLREYLENPFWAGGGGQERATAYYRPLVTLSFALDRAVHGSNAAGYHITNVVLHLGCAWLLLALLRRTGAREATATLLSVGWALQPRLAECAAWISGRTDLLASLFAFGALHAWGQTWPRRLCASLLLGLGLLAKESALAVLPAIAVAEWIRAAPAATRARAQLVATRTAPLLVTLSAYVVLRLGLVGYTGGGRSFGGGYRALMVLHTIGTYTEMVLDAWRPRAVIGRQGVITALSIGIGVATLAVLAWAVHRFWRRVRPEAAAGFALAAFALLPVLHIAPLPLRTLAADRFLYLPTAGLALGLAPGLDRWLGVARARWAAVAALVLSLGVVAFQRVAVWSDEVEFWVTTYLETPRINSAPATELFGVFYRAGLYRDALTIAERTLSYDDPNKRDPRYNASVCLTRLGRPEEALRGFHEASVETKPSAGIQVVMAILSVQLGRSDQARAILEPLARTGYRDAQTLLARLPELEGAWVKLAALPPDGDPEERARLAALVGDDPVAVAAWTEVVRRPTASERALHDAVRYLVQTGEHAALAAAVRVYVSRFGALEPELAAMVEVRLAEIERLQAVKPRLGLR